MADLKLDIFVLQTYNVKTLAVVDASIYPDDPPVVTSPSINITPPGFPSVELPFTIQDYNLFNSYSLGLSAIGVDYPLPDGVYVFRYSIAPAFENFVEKSFMRIDKIQEKFDSAFMTLDMMECDMGIKAQAKVELSTIYYLIQGSMASANNCAITQSVKLYNKADSLLDRFISGGCGCGSLNH